MEFLVVMVGLVIAAAFIITAMIRPYKLKANKFVIVIEYRPVTQMYRGTVHTHSWWDLFPNLGNEIIGTSSNEYSVVDAARACEDKLTRLLADQKELVKVYINRSELTK